MSQADTLGTLRARLAEQQALLGGAEERVRILHDALKEWRQRAEVAEAALQQIMIGGNHLASALIGWLGAGESTFPPYSASLDDARKIIPDVDHYDAWVCWKFIMEARDATRKEDRVVVEGIQEKPKCE